MQVAMFDYGMKKKDPLEEMYYYKKDKPDSAFPVKKDQVNYMYSQFNGCGGESICTIYSYLRCYLGHLWKSRSEFIARKRNVRKRCPTV